MKCMKVYREKSSKVHTTANVVFVVLRLHRGVILIQQPASLEKQHEPSPCH